MKLAIDFRGREQLPPMPADDGLSFTATFRLAVPLEIYRLNVTPIA